MESVATWCRRDSTSSNNVFDTKMDVNRLDIRPKNRVTANPQIIEPCRHRTGPEDERQVLDFLLGERPENPAVGRDPAVDSRGRLHASVEDDCELAPDVVARHPAEFSSAFGRERETHGRLV